MASLTVACVLRSGGDFSALHVELLRDQVAHHLPGARFVCLSDVPVQCERIPLITGWSGWWSKLELFRPGVLTGRVLYFDLDTLIIDSLEQIAAHPHRFTIGKNWRVPGEFNSAFMAWEGDFSHLFDRFNMKVAKNYERRDRWGDQGYITDTLNTQPENAWEVFPGQFVSFKLHCDNGVPAGARVVCFHGRPRPWYAKEKWIREFYERAAA